MIQTTSGTALAGVLLLGLLAGPAASQEPADSSIRDGGGVTTSRDKSGKAAETMQAEAPSRRQTFDAAGHVVREEELHPDGERRVEHFLNDAEGVKIGRAWDLTDAQFESFLRRLGLSQATQRSGLSSRTEAGTRRSYAWGSLTRERHMDRSEVSAEILGQRMKVTAVQESADVVRTTDDWGGDRRDTYGPIPVYMRSGFRKPDRRVVKSEDAWGLLAEVSVDAEGNPTEVRYGENLLVRYHHDLDLLLGRSPSVWATVWREVVDLRSGETVLDSRLVPPGPRPLFRLGSLGGIRVESTGDGRLVGVVPHPDRDDHGLLPVDDGELWRRVEVGSVDPRLFLTRVDYTPDRLRVTFMMPELTVEVPRSRTSTDPVKLVTPAGVDLPLPGDPDLHLAPSPALESANEWAKQSD